jgi:hypothetical protein
MDILREKMAKVGLHYGNCLALLFMMTSILYMMSAMNNALNSPLSLPPT